MAESSSISVDVGAVASEGLRLWCAKQAVETAKERLAFQEACMDGIMGRSAQTLGWCVTLSCAFLALTVSQKLPLTMAAFSGFSAITAFCSIMVMKPSGWVPAMQTPQWFLTTKLLNELAVLEHMALSFQSAIETNRPRITVCARWLNLSWVSFALMPLAATLTHLLTGR
ncbi:MAG: hypothetical protein ABF553_07490 [Acetobacter orientalis]|uniref:hypothetical protein n=1 Tax=Acetobacter orientalis TaxID=146474 RepID=UPI0039EB8E0B